MLKAVSVSFNLIILQATKFIQYFFYLAWNWNFRIAWHILLNDVKGEKKYGIKTTGADELKELEQKGIDISHATIYMPASYDLLEDTFDRFKDKVPKHFIDIGCGKGRAMCVAAHYHFTKITGIDFSAKLCNDATQNLKTTSNKHGLFSWEVINNDAFYYELPEDVDCIFLFNPFDEVIMSGMIKNIEKSLKRSPRDISIIYFNPLQKKLFTDKGFKEIYQTKKLNYLEGCILEKRKR